MCRRPPRFTRTSTRLPSTTLCRCHRGGQGGDGRQRGRRGGFGVGGLLQAGADRDRGETAEGGGQGQGEQGLAGRGCVHAVSLPEARSGAASMAARSEEHTSELQSLMRISYAVFCLKKKKQKQHTS